MYEKDYVCSKNIKYNVGIYYNSLRKMNRDNLFCTIGVITKTKYPIGRATHHNSLLTLCSVFPMDSILVPVWCLKRLVLVQEGSRPDASLPFTCVVPQEAGLGVRGQQVRCQPSLYLCGA
jgi:hypothetical protein